MTPRFVSEREKQIKRQRDRADITDFRLTDAEIDRRFRESVDELRRETQLEKDFEREKTQARISARDRRHYGPGSRYSYFRDLVAVRLADKDRAYPGQGVDDFATAEARNRLSAAMEKRDVSSADPGARSIMPVAAPGEIALEVANSAVATATLAAALRNLPLPEVGMRVDLPRVESGPSVAVQSAEGGAVAEVDFDTGTVQVPVGVIAGQVDVTRQVFDRSGWEADVTIAAELGRRYGEVLDAQTVAGSGSNQQILGLATVGGTIAVSYTDASPTALKTASKVWSAYSSLATPSTGYGTPSPDAYIVAMHPRRLAAQMALQGATAPGPVPELPGTVVASGGIRTNISTSQDEIFVVERSQAVLFNSPSRILVEEQPGDAEVTALKVRVQVLGYAALAANRQPLSVARITGTGLAAPVL
jgi:HK97 family phage major capsid protein